MKKMSYSLKINALDAYLDLLDDEENLELYSKANMHADEVMKGKKTLCFCVTDLMWRYYFNKFLEKNT